MPSRDEFSPQVKQALADRVGNKCSNPECQAPTCGPGTDPAKAINLGVAAHITAAAAGGPRYNPTLTKDERRSATNGVWLCQVCAKLIDSDPPQFPEPLLREWKRQMEERAKQELGRAMSIPANGMAVVDQKLSALLSVVQSSSGPSPDQIDAELDDIKQELDKHNPTVARLLVERILNRHGNKLTDRQKWRAKTQLAATYLAEGALEKGARLLLEAVVFQPAEDKARTNEAVAYELLQNQPKAHELACQLRQDLPHSATALAIWVRTAPTTVTSEELEREASRLTSSDAEVCIALADRLIVRESLQHAESYARTATGLQPSWPHAWLMLANVLHRKGGDETVVSARAAILREASVCYDRAIEFATAQQDKRVAYIALVNRGILHEVAEQFDSASDDYRQAIQLLPNNPDAIDRYATLLAFRDRPDEAVEQARRAAELAPRGRHEFIYAATLFDRNRSDDRQRAVEIWCRLVRDGAAEVWDRALDCAVLGLCELGRPAEADALLKDASTERVALPVRHLCAARISFATGDRDAATARAGEAIATVDGTTSLTTRLSLSHLLVTLGLDADVIPLLTPVARRGAFDVVTRYLLDCARRTNNHGLFLRLCAELREAGVREGTLRRSEFEILSQYDPLAAAALVQAYLADNPDDRFALLRLTFLGHQCERSEWVTTDLSKLPEPSEVTPATVGRMVMTVLYHEGRALDALRFGYELLRAHPNDPDANHSYIGLFMLCDTRAWPLTADIVATNVAVCVKEVGKDAVEWRIVEPDRPNESVGEFPADHPRIAPLLGLQVGAQFVFAPGIKPRMGEVVALQSKYLYRFEQARDSYQAKFHDRHDFQMVEVVQKLPDGSEQLDLAPIFAAENQRNEYVEGIIQQYKARLMPIHVLSQLIGRDVFETIDALQSPGLGVRCWNGADAEWNRALTELSQASTVVLDVTALFTLGRLGLLSRQFTRPGTTFVVSYGTFDHLRDLTSNKFNSSGRAHWVPTQDGRYALLEVPEDVMRQERDFRADVMRWVRQYCAVVGCRELAELSPERREHLVDVVGRDGAESVCLATRPNHILWTDDLTLGVFARGWLNTTRYTWTQVSLSHAVEIGAMTAEEYAIATANLIGRGYNSLNVDSAAIAAAGVIANWASSAFPLARALELFRDKALANDARVTIATRFILRLFYLTRCSTTQQAVVFALLNHIRSKRVAEIIARQLPRIFTTDTFSARAAVGMVISWLRQTNAPR